jgi:alkylation response protein AidB-like acyl-CoA dehydrogenase
MNIEDAVDGQPDPEEAPRDMAADIDDLSRDLTEEIEAHRLTREQLDAALHTFRCVEETEQYRAVLTRAKKAEAELDAIRDTRFAWDAMMQQLVAARIQAKKAEAGYAAITWSKDWGGRGGSAIEQVIYNQEESKYAIPRGMFDIGLGMCIPTICTWGTQAHRERFARKALRGEEVWCQLFSEPAGGSDVAGLRTRAEKNGDNWIVNGQKIWTSGAHYSDYGLLITRTDPNVPKHKGLTMFFLDMKSKGVEIRPIKQANGMQEFNEVYFTDV